MHLRVVMPDHMHLLLMVNYDKDPGFNPLVFTHWFMGESARMIATVEDSRYLAAHRQLMLSALPVGAPFDWTTCHTMNDRAAAMCRRARGEV